MLEIPPFCLEYHRRPPAEREAYVMSELVRLRDSDSMRLSTILACGSDEAATVALRLLRDGAYDTEGRELVEADWAPRLRLIDKAVPPERDPQNRLLPDGKRGRVLVTKVGLRRFEQGGDRFIADRLSRDIYEMVEVGPQAKPYRMAHAVAVLRAWGRGVAPEHDRWIVEEVSRDTPAHSAGKKAA